MLRRRKNSAFTLLELVLVMVLVLVIVSVSWPRLAPFSRAKVLSANAESVLTLTQLAAAEAIATSDEHRLEIYPTLRRVKLMRRRGSVFTAVAAPSGTDIELPEGIRLSVDSLDDDSDMMLTGGSEGDRCWSLAFAPDATHPAVRITLENQSGETTYVYALGQLEPFRLTSDYDETRP